MGGQFGIIVKGIVKYEDKYLILKKWYDDNIVNPFQWEFADGNLEEGESPDNAVYRVIKEITELDVTINSIQYTWNFIIGDTNYIGICYICDTNTDIAMIAGEYTEYKWVQSSELLDYIENTTMITDLKRVGIIQ